MDSGAARRAARARGIQRAKQATGTTLFYSRCRLTACSGQQLVEYCLKILREWRNQIAGKITISAHPRSRITEIRNLRKMSSNISSDLAIGKSDFVHTERWSGRES